MITLAFTDKFSQFELRAQERDQSLLFEDLLEPSPQFIGIPRTMPDSEHPNLPVFEYRIVSAVPEHRIMPLPFRLGIDFDCEAHRFARRPASNSAKTCSADFPRPGFFKASSARQSSSATCSGVSSGSLPSSAIESHNSCASSMRSFNGKDLAALKISVALMPASYPRPVATQAAFRSTVRLPHCALP
jgi:hypothetical protein